MKQAQVLYALRKILKAQRITYKILATRIGTTESALKNTFHSHSLSLDRLLEILEAIPLDAKRFFAAVEAEENLRFSFSEAQEQFFVENNNYFRFFQEIFFNRKTLEEVKAEHGLSEISVHRYIQHIEQQGIWTYQGNGAFRFYVSGPLNWRFKGPWMRKYYPVMTARQAESVLGGEMGYSDFVSFGMMSLPTSLRRQFELEVEKVIETYREKAYHAHLLATTNRDMFGWNLLITSRPVDVSDDSIPNI